MGNQKSREFAQAVANGDTNLEAALTYHFRNNHYPPLPYSLIPIAIRIIKGEVKGIHVRLPEGITYQGSTSAPVSACIEAWHLDAFLPGPDNP